MASTIWFDPILPKLRTPTADFLKANPVRFGNYLAFMTPHQWEFTYCREQFPCWVGGVRSGKTFGAIFRGLWLSLFIPNNEGIVGRLTATDLADTTQKDWYDIADATGMVKSRNERKLVLYNCDFEGRQLPSKTTSEVLYLHFDDPNHLKGHGKGWFHMEEMSECAPNSYFRLVDRLSLPTARGFYTGFGTSNPEGRNWVWNHWFNQETVLARTENQRLKHRAIHNKTTENYTLDPEYIENLLATAPAEWVRRYVEGEFDVFEGQIFKEFSYDIHCVKAGHCMGFEGGNPPRNWARYMGIDTGGADPWAFELCAVDPWGNLIWYDEVYRPETYTASFKDDVLPKMDGLKFQKIPMDYENKAAMEELRRIGIRATNAVKRDKREGAINKLARYLHPNPTRPFPEWHPRAGEPGAPAMFFTERAKKAVEEIPQQRWRTLQGANQITLNEPDPHVADHATSAIFYVVRERPEPVSLPKMNVALRPGEERPDARSRRFWQKQAEAKEKEKKRRRQYGPLHVETKRKDRIWIQ